MANVWFRGLQVKNLSLVSEHTSIDKNCLYVLVTTDTSSLLESNALDCADVPKLDTCTSVESPNKGPPPLRTIPFKMLGWEKLDPQNSKFLGTLPSLG